MSEPVDIPVGFTRRRWTLVLTALVTAVLVGLAAFSIGRLTAPGNSRPGTTSAEAGFARDMQVHHDQGVELARGLANYSSAEARLLCRKPSSAFERLLGYAAEPEMVHRDNMVLMPGAR